MTATTTLMKYSFLLIILALAHNYSASLAPDSKTDFSGTWQLDMKASYFGGALRSDLNYDGLTLIIAHRDPEVRITRRISRKKRERLQELVYFADGRGESNPTFDGSSTIKSKTSWDGAKLVSTSATRVSSAPVTIESTDHWELSADGNTLFLRTDYKETTIDPMLILSPRDSIKRVFRRVP